MTYCSPTSLANLASKLKGNVNGQWVNIPGPGHSNTDRSLGVKPDSKSVHGFVVNSFAGDDPDLCVQHVKALLAAGSPGSALTAVGVAQKSTGQKEKIDLAAQIWNGAVAIQNTLAASYLKTRKCLTPDAMKCEALKFSPMGRFMKNLSPALYGAMSDANNGEFRGIHRTAISLGGEGKNNFCDGTPSKMMLGVASNSVVRLAPFAPILGIAEGIETALSAALIFKTPVWAALSAGGVSKFPVLPSIKYLKIFADNDAAGHAAASCCAQRYAESGIRGCTQFPPIEFNDWNDVLVNAGRGA